MRRATVLMAAAGNLVATAAECAAGCVADEKCNAWQWCDDVAGCAPEFGSAALPKGGCLLQSQKLAPSEPLFGWLPSRFSAGYNGGEYDDGGRSPEACLMFEKAW